MTREQTALVLLILQQASDTRHCLSLTEMLGHSTEEGWLLNDHRLDEVLDQALAELRRSVTFDDASAICFPGDSA